MPEHQIRRHHPDGLLTMYEAAHRADAAPSELAVSRQWIEADRAWLDARHD